MAVSHIRQVLTFSLLNSQHIRALSRCIFLTVVRARTQAFDYDIHKQLRCQTGLLDELVAWKSTGRDSHHDKTTWRLSDRFSGYLHRHGGKEVSTSLYLFCIQ
jgi:hypothetical protein